MNLTITQDNTRTEILGSEGSSLAHKLYEIASDQNNTVSLTGSISVPYAYADEVEYLNTNFGPGFNITAGGTWIKFYHQEIEDGIMSWASYNPNNVGANFASSGHITQDDADSITNWGKKFTGNTNITQFNEFEKFRNVTQVSLNDCFLSCTNLQSIKLPPRLTNIRGWMFNGCSSLSGVVLPASCTTIDSSGFAGCTSLTSIDLSNVTTLGNSAFKNSGITGVLELPNLTLLGDECFKGTSITKLLDLGSVTSIPGRICDGLTTLTEVTIPNTCHTLSGYGHFCNCSNLTKVNGLSNLTNIGNLAFSHTSLINNNLSELVNVTTLNKDTFSECDIPGELNLPNLLIANNSEFGHCKNITKVKCLNKLSSIPNGFLSMWKVPNDTLLTEVYLPKECITIGDSGFYGCELLTTIKQYTDSIDDWVEGQTPSYGDLIGITNVGQEAFRLCKSLLSINLPNVTTIGKWAFRDCIALSSINLSNVVTIGYGAFLNCSALTQITLPTTLRTVGYMAFFGTHILTLIFPYGMLAFSDLCRSDTGKFLLYMLFPSTMLTISLWDMYRDTSNPITCYIVILNPTVVSTNRNSSDTSGYGQGWGWSRPNLAKFYVPDAAVNNYKASDQWSVLADYIFPISQLETDSPTYWLIYQANKDYGVPLSNS